MAALQAYRWPGNVRELRNAVERAMLLAEGNELNESHFPMLSARDGELSTGMGAAAGGINLEALERSLVVQALERSGWNQTRPATLLGLNRDQIRYRIEKFELEKPLERSYAWRPAATGTVKVTVVPPAGGHRRRSAALQFDQPLGGRHAEAGAARLGRLERTEQRGADLGGNAGAGIGDLDASASHRGRVASRRSVPLALHRLRGIDQQVLERRSSSASGRRAPAARRRHRHVEIGERRVALEQRDHRVEQRTQIDAHRLGRRRAREHQQILDQVVEAVDPGDDFLDDRGVAGFGRQPRADHLDGAAHRGERVLDLVRDHRGHLAEPRQRGGFAQLILELGAARQVVQDAGEVLLAVDLEFADREMQRERLAVAAPPGDGAADADDPPLAGREVMLDIAVVLRRDAARASAC